MDAPAPKVVIIILNWNGGKDTVECLESLQAVTYSNYEIVVIDNGSTDDSVRLINSLRALLSFHLIETGKNMGFAEGNNVGLRYAQKNSADYVLLLNNDTVVDPQFITELVKAGEARKEAAVISGKILYFHEPQRIWYAGAKWIPSQHCFIHVGIDKIDDHSSFEDATETDYASGCAFFIRTSTLHRIGLLDSRFFLTYEESDFCYRARAAGFSVLYEPRARLWHKVSVSFGGNQSPLQLYFYQRNILLWGERHLSFSEFISLLIKTFNDTFRFTIGDKAESTLLRRLFWAISSTKRRLQRGGDDLASRARWLGFRDYLMRRFGDCPQEVRELNSLLKKRAPEPAL